MTSVDTDTGRRATKKTAKKVAKKAAGAAKGGAKKAASTKKTAAKKTEGRATSNAGRRATFSPDQKITSLMEANPSHARLALIAQCNGKTIKTYLEKGGRLSTLNRAVKKGYVKIS